ncbi:MAG: hypothetical protein KC933_17330 [Myxococcales bacterium]|nr:hypothetical protein [Myxococcales bacterium]
MSAVSAGILGAVLLACGGEPSPVELYGYTPEPADGLPQIDQALTPLTTACSWDSGTGIALVTVESGETAVIAKRLVDSAVIVNGVACGAATTTTLKKVSVVENSSATGDETVVLDFLNGLFAVGSSAGVGFDIDLGGSGADTFAIRGSSSADRVTLGASGFTTNTDTTLDITFANIDDIVVTLSGGNDVFSAQGSATAGAAYTGDNLVVFGGDGNDTLTGGDGDDTINGGAGDDIIAGYAGDDTLNGDAGNDTFNEGSASNGADSITCGAGVDTVNYGSRSNALIITMASGADDGENGEGDDVKSDCDNLTGGAGNDTITGNALANTIDGGAGNDTLTGGAGNDIFPQGSADDGSDVIAGGIGNDLVDYSSRTSTLTVTMGDATANDGESGEGDNIGSDVEWLDAGSGNDTITGNDADNSINAGAGDDTVSGGLGNDEIFGGTGVDTLNGDAGDDTIDGGGDADVVDCGAGEGDIGFAVANGGTRVNCEL